LRWRLVSYSIVSLSDDIAQIQWQGNKDSNLGMPESKSGALTNLAIPLRNLLFAVLSHLLLMVQCFVKPILGHEPDKWFRG